MRMREKAVSVVASLALATALCPGAALAAGEPGDGALVAAGESSALAVQANALATQDGVVDFTQPVDKTYSFSGDGAHLDWSVTEPGIAYVNVKVEGVDKLTYMSRYSRDKNSSFADLGVVASNRTVTADGFTIKLRCSKPCEGEIDFMKPDDDKGTDKTVSLHVTSEFKKVDATVKNVASGEKVDVVQAAGTLYWPIELKKASKVLLSPGSSLVMSGNSDTHGVGLYNSKKKVIEYYLDSNARYAYMLPKGTYYIGTCVADETRVDELSFSYSATSVGNFAAAANTSRAKAKKVKLGKKVAGLIATSNPDVKAYYYKLKLSSDRDITVTCSNGKGVYMDLSILSKKGKALYESVGSYAKGKALFYLNKRGTKKAEKVSLKKGVYYVKVSHYGSSYGKYAFTVK